MKPVRRDVLRGALGAACLTAYRGPAAAQGRYPTRAIAIINPFAPGGLSDPVGRVVARHLQAALGQPVLRSGQGRA